MFELPSAQLLSAASLAYLGDAVLELMTRQHLLKSGALLTDVTGVKRSIVYQILSIIKNEDLLKEANSDE